MKCLIIAAGAGERIRGLHESKPLLPLAGRPLIQHVMESILEGGVDEFVVVTGYLGDRVRTSLDDYARSARISITHVVNEQWNRPNGLSVVCAADKMDGPFLLTMCDHLFDPSIVRDLLRQELLEGETILAIDADLENPLVDLDDVTRVQVEDDRIARLGKGLEPYNAFDTGIFFATPALFEAIEWEGTDGSLTGGMNELAKLGRARAMPIGRRFWLDVDDPRAARQAVAYVADRLSSRPRAS